MSIDYVVGSYPSGSGEGHPLAVLLSLYIYLHLSPVKAATKLPCSKTALSILSSSTRPPSDHDMAAGPNSDSRYAGPHRSWIVMEISEP